MRRIAMLALSVSAAFLTIVAVALNSAALFYMGTAMIATLAVCRLQAWLSVRGLRFERLAPAAVTAGETVTVELAVLSNHSIRRPLVSVVDQLPGGLAYADRTPSLPVAPSPDTPACTQYRFRPLSRGVFHWNGLVVSGSDALGLIRMSKAYRTEPTEITVLPAPIPVQVDVPRSSGWGLAESEHGLSRGAGIEPRGIREYGAGDSLRFVHWRSSARTGRLLVKEFETGAYGRAAFLLQRTYGSDVGPAGGSSLDRACGHLAYMAQQFLKQGTVIALPGLVPPGSARLEYADVAAALASVEATSKSTAGEDLLAHRSELPQGATVYVTLSQPDETLPIAAAGLQGLGVHIVALIYDPAEFEKPSRRRTLASPTESGYLARLRAAGVQAYIMPRSETE